MRKPPIAVLVLVAAAVQASTAFAQPEELNPVDPPAPTPTVDDADLGARSDPPARHQVVPAAPIQAVPAVPPPPPPPLPPPPPETDVSAAPSAPAALQPKLSALWFLTTLYGSKGGDTFSRFTVGRGYLGVKLEPVDWFHARMTLDAHQNDDGAWAMRLKYLYGLLRIGDAGNVVTDTSAEYGIVHTPWLDYEEHINHYRMQGTMFLERNGLFNSADLGATLSGLLGPKLDEEYRGRVSKHYPGRWGSFAVGVYNGGGYDAKEANENKVLQGRLSLRPFGDLFPNLQISYHGVLGKGNAEPAPDWRVHAGMLSVEHEYFVFTATGTTGVGNQKGGFVDAKGDALDFRGFSGFAEIKLPFAHASAIGRYDRFWWDWSGDRTLRERFIGGIAYHFLDNNTLLLHYDRVNDGSASKPDEDAIAMTARIELP